MVLASYPGVRGGGGGGGVGRALFARPLNLIAIFFVMMSSCGLGFAHEASTLLLSKCK